jgi:ribosome-associated heat shock protein Hsp15
MQDRFAEHEEGGAARIDRWLFAVRFFKSRSLAAQAVSGGKVHVNGDRVKPSRTVHIGDLVSFMRGNVAFDCRVLALPERRGPAKEAVRCYEETPESQKRRAEFSERMRMAAALTPSPDSRPDKHDRKVLRRLRGRD